MGERAAEDEVVRREHELREAVRRQDRAALEALVGAEFSLTSDRLNVGRDEWIALAVGPFKVRSSELQEARVRVYGDVAVVDARVRQEAALGGAAARALWLVTDVWVRRGGRWQIVKRHASAPEAG